MKQRRVHANILAGAQRVLDLIQEYESAPPESARSGILLEQIEHFDGWNLEHRIKSLITNLHAPEPGARRRDSYPAARNVASRFAARSSRGRIS